MRVRPVSLRPGKCCGSGSLISSDGVVCGCISTGPGHLQPPGSSSRHLLGAAGPKPRPRSRQAARDLIGGGPGGLEHQRGPGYRGRTITVHGGGGNVPFLFAWVGSVGMVIYGSSVLLFDFRFPFLLDAENIVKRASVYLADMKSLAEQGLHTFHLLLKNSHLKLCKVLCLHRLFSQLFFLQVNTLRTTFTEPQVSALTLLWANIIVKGITSVVCQ